MNLALQSEDASLDLSIFGSNNLSPAEYRERVTEAEEILLTLPQVEPEVTQHFLPGLYSRSITIPVGMVLTGGVQKASSLIIVSAGKIVVATEDGNVTVEAPATFKGKSGVKRIAYCLEECVWTNVYPYSGEPQDAETMKELIISTSYEDYEVFLAREDYSKFLQENNWTEEEVVAMVVETSDVRPFEEETFVAVGASKISCNGILVTKDFEAGEYIGKGSKGVDRTFLTRFTNHSHRPNVLLSIADGDLVFKAAFALSKGQELLVNYRDVIDMRRGL